MIIDEINKNEEKRKEIEKIKNRNINLPKPYNLEYFDDSVIISTGKIFKQNIAELKLKDDVIEVYFNDEEDLEILRDSFRNSETKFKLIVGDFYY